MKCSKCKKEVNIVWNVLSNQSWCFDCLYPHEKQQMIKDSLSPGKFGESMHKALELAGYYK